MSRPRRLSASDRAGIRARIAGWEAAAEATRRQARAEKADPGWSSRLAVSMNVAAEGLSRSAPDPVREREVAAVRRIWTRLKRGVRRSWRKGPAPHNS